MGAPVRPVSRFAERPRTVFHWGVIPGERQNPGAAAPLPGSAAPPAPESGTRLVSLDAYRGAVMLLMASSGFAFGEVAKRFPDSPVWAFLGRQTDHATWVGCTVWDLIQPAFMFMVGVALPWSVANRRARGLGMGSMFRHALWRSVLLLLLSLYLGSTWSQRTDWGFTSVLAQIGLGYPLLFLLAFATPRRQATAAGLILAASWAWFALHPLPPPDLDPASVGLPADWPRLVGFEAHWEKNTNAAAAFDRWFLNLFPRESVHHFNRGGYQTLNFVPSLATMIFGLLAGGVLRGAGPVEAKLRRLAAWGVAGVAAGALLGAAGWCPLVKRIWTPSFALFSGGWVTLLLVAFVWAVDVRGGRRWAFPLVVAGLNPITLYVLWQLLPGHVANTLKIHLGPGVFGVLGEPFAASVQRAAVLAVFWVILWWMHRRRIFIRL